MVKEDRSAIPKALIETERENHFFKINHFSGEKHLVIIRYVDRRYFLYLR